MGLSITMFVIFILGLFVVVGCWLAARSATKDSDGEFGAWLGVVAGIILMCIGGISLTVFAHQSVPARNVGVVTSNGKPTGVVQNGGHWMAPWAKVTMFPTTIQPLTYEQKVRLKNNTEAYVDVNAQWQIDPNNQFLQLYFKYQTFDAVRDNVIKRQLGVALNNQFADWDPIEVIDKATGNTTVSVTDFAGPVQQAVNAHMPGGLVLNSVAITSIRYSDEVQKNLDNITTAAAQTRVAQQQEQTNAAQAAANAKLGNGIQAYQQNCLNTTNNAIATRFTLPAGWNCNGAGGNTPITVAAK